MQGIPLDKVEYLKILSEKLIFSCQIMTVAKQKTCSTSNPIANTIDLRKRSLLIILHAVYFHLSLGVKLCNKLFIRESVENTFGKLTPFEA